MSQASGGVWNLLDEIPGTFDDYEDGLCGCGDDVTAVMEIDAGDLLISCSTCGKSLIPFDDWGSVCMEPLAIDVEFVQEHHHNWDTIGCDCNYWFELKTKVPKE